jgi:hypothetical protein
LEKLRYRCRFMGRVLNRNLSTPATFLGTILFPSLIPGPKFPVVASPSAGVSSNVITGAPEKWLWCGKRRGQLRFNDLSSMTPAQDANSPTKPKQG